MQSKILTVILSVLVVIGIGYIAYEFFEKKSAFKSGDIIFQTSLTNESEPLQIATKSKYTHCGIIYRDSGNIYVYEAGQPAKITLLDEWIKKGKNGSYTVRRLKNAKEVLTPDALAKLKAECGNFLGKDYDLAFEWSDDRIYCSEFVWKVYDRALGIQIGEFQKLKDFDLGAKLIQSILDSRYGGAENIPWDNSIISAPAIFNSALLKTVKDVYPAEQ